MPLVSPSSSRRMLRSGSSTRLSKNSDHGCASTLAVAVRHHDHPSLPVRPVDHGNRAAGHWLPDRLLPYGKGEVPPAHQVLRQALPHQLRHGRRDGHRPGVPIRHELVGLLTIRRRRVRRTSGDGRTVGVLPRVEPPWPVDPRMGPTAQGPAPCDDLDRRKGRRCRPTSSSPRTRSCSIRSDM